MPKIRTISPLPKHMADATLTQVLVQNTWYTLLDTADNVVINQLSFLIDTANETIATKITVDGVTVTGTTNATANLTYVAYPYYGIDSADTLICFDTGSAIAPYGRPLMSGRSVKIEFRKTTAAGNGTFKAKAIYDKW